MVHMDSENKELNTKSDYACSVASKQHEISNSIILYPFAHQVGGHTQLLTLDKSTLCKPLIPRELLFYLNVPKELTKFVPAYKGVVQIRETGAGTYPPVVYQPLRSPKSPYSKYGPGSSCTLPAKLGARLMTQSLAYNDRSKTKRLINDSLITNKNKNCSIPENEDLTDETTETLLPRFLHSNYRQHHNQHLSNNKQNFLQQPSYQHNHLTSTTTNSICLDSHIVDAQDHYSNHSSSPMTTDEIDHHHHQHLHYPLHGNKQNNCHKIVTSVDRNIRESSEENSNSSSDQTNGGYFSEDSSQSITDLTGSPFELKVQLRQCSDEKILKKNLSNENLLRADYISRPNEKCKYFHISY